MKKPTMLYASPLPPMKSGISDYSEVLVTALRKEFDITLLTADYEISSKNLKQNCRVLKYRKGRIDFGQYDYRVYHIGNNPEYHDYIYEACLAHPGLVILHDFVLYYLFVGYYQKRGQLYSKVFEQEGIEAFLTLKEAVKKKGTDLLVQKELAHLLPFNKELLRSKNRFMVHSLYAYNSILDTGLVKENKVTKIHHIALLDEDARELPKAELYKKYHIPQDAYVIASMGYIDPTKQNHTVCRVIRRLKKNADKKICYVMAGEGNYVDSYVDGETIIKTGYTSLDEFNSFIKHADLMINLRSPSMGETSGAMLRILQQGKVCMINDGGWFSEIPDDCVYKVDLERAEDDMYEKIHHIMCHPGEACSMGERAAAYIKKEYDLRVIIDSIKKFIE